MELLPRIDVVRNSHLMWPKRNLDQKSPKGKCAVPQSDTTRLEARRRSAPSMATIYIYFVPGNGVSFGIFAREPAEIAVDIECRW